MLDFDLSALYEVETKVLNQSVKRNRKRFPADFMFRLTTVEWETIRSQFVTTSVGASSMRSQIVTASQGKRNIGVTPYAFTEQGVAMLSGILNSDKAINMNIAIMRAFVEMKDCFAAGRYKGAIKTNTATHWRARRTAIGHLRRY
jgi:hypothetical protein